MTKVADSTGLASAVGGLYGGHKNAGETWLLMWEARTPGEARRGDGAPLGRGSPLRLRV